MNWEAMGLAHLSPFQPCFVMAKSSPPPKKLYSKHPALRSRAYTSACALCETKLEQQRLRNKYIREWEAKSILRVNKESDVGRSTNNDKSARIRKATI